jgi:predicted kinase
LIENDALHYQNKISPSWYGDWWLSLIGEYELTTCYTFGKNKIMEDTKETLYMICGIPGSGKSTLSNQLRFENHDAVYICPDEIRKELTGNMIDQTKNNQVFGIVFKRLKDAMIDGKTIIYDATNYNRKNRSGILDIAKQFNYNVVVYEMSTPHDVSRERNKKRDRVVPDFVLDKMINGYQPPSTSSEYIHKIIRTENSDSIINGIDYVSLLESPSRFPNLDFNNFGKRENNLSLTMTIKNKGKFIEKYKNYDVYSYNDYTDFDNMDVFIYGALFYASFMYDTKGTTILQKSIWQEPFHLGLCREIILDYYLKKFNKIVSDGWHTELGEKYWNKLFKEAQTHGYKTYIGDSNGNKISDDVKDLDKYYGNTNKHLNYRLVIEK